MLIGNTLYPIEIKSSATPKSTFLAPLNRFKELAAPFGTIADGLLVYQVEQAASLPNGNQCIPWQEFYAWLDEKLNP